MFPSTVCQKDPWSLGHDRQAFFHMNRHKFKPMTSFNLDAPSIKLYVDTTKDPGWQEFGLQILWLWF